MSDERIDIEITDSVDPGTAKKLRDIATAATEADTALERLKKSSKDVDSSAVDKLSTAASKLSKETDDLAKAQVANTNAQKKGDKANKESVKSLSSLDEAAESVVVSLKAGVPATQALRTAVVGLLATALPLLAVFIAMQAAQAIVNALFDDGSKDVERYDKAIDELEDSVSALRTANKEASASVEEQAKLYGGSAEEVRNLLEALQDLREEQALVKLNAGLEELAKQEPFESLRVNIGAANSDLRGLATIGIAIAQEKVAALGLTADEAQQYLAKFDRLKTAKTFEEAAAAAADLRQFAEGVGGVFADRIVPTLVEFEANARSAFGAAIEGATDAEKAIADAEKAMRRLTDRFSEANTTAQLQLEYRGDPVGLAGALAEQQALREQAPIRANGGDTSALDSEVAAIREQAEETERLRQRVIELDAAERQRQANKREEARKEEQATAKRQRDDERAARQAEADFNRQANAYENLQRTILQFDKSDAGKIARVQATEDARLEVVRASLAKGVINQAQADADIIAIRRETADELYAIEFPNGEDILEGIKGPINEYKDTIRELNELLRLGKITSEEYNAALAQTGVGAGIKDLQSFLMPDYEFQMESLNTFYAERFAIIEQARQADLANKERYDQLEIDLERKKQAEILAIERARQAEVLGGLADASGGVLDVLKQAGKEQTGIYKAMFVAHKAFATAEAVINTSQAVTNALANYPVPVNFIMAGVAAAQGAIQIAKINSAGFMDGGYTGNMPTNAIAGAVHGQEYVFDAAATKRIGVGNLENMRRQGSVPAYRAPRAATANDNSGPMGSGNGPVTVNISTPDLRSFMASESQVAAATARAVNRGQRNL